MSTKRGVGNQVASGARELPAADTRFMALALIEARKGLGRTAPNPAVGAVVVRGTAVVGLGHHVQAGAPHAEIVALRAAGVKAKGATLYVTLEPCNHQGRTPPCSEAILAAGLARVVYASDDPNPRVSGRGAARLRRAGVRVDGHVLQTEAHRLNRAWFHFITSGVPFVTLKVATTMDGRLASASGDSRWVTGPAARALVHKLRDEVDAVLVGAGTVLADDPELTARGPGLRSPLRVILDGKLRTRATAKVFRPGHLLFTATAVATGDSRTVERLGGRGGRFSLVHVLRKLGERGVVHLLVEGGAEVFSAFLEAGLWDELQLFVAPKLAGPQGLPWFVGKSAPRLRDALVLGRFVPQAVGDDALLIVERHPKVAL